MSRQFIRLDGLLLNLADIRSIRDTEASVIVTYANGQDEMFVGDEAAALRRWIAVHFPVLAPSLGESSQNDDPKADRDIE